MTSLSADLPVIGGWEFDSDNVALWPRFKQIELVRTIGARKLSDPEESPICFLSTKMWTFTIEKTLPGSDYRPLRFFSW